MWESNSLFYIIVLCQIVVTLVLVPRLIKANLVNSFKPYLDEQDERLKLSLEQALSKLIKHYLIICNLLTVITTSFVIQAWHAQTELLNWDNQAGVVLLSLMAASTIVFISVGLHKCRKITLQFSQNVRRASLKVRRWQDYLPYNLIAIIVLVQAALIGSVFYFMSNPFDGFGGAANFIGISVLNGIFIFCIANLLTKNSWPTGITEQQKHISKLRGIKISCLVWLLASIYLMISLWLSASALKDFQLLSQSIYMMVILLIGTRFFELPRKSDLM